MFFAAVPVVSVKSQALAQGSTAEDGEDGVLVARISLVEGQLLRFVPAEKDWVATVKDAPFGLDDALYSGDNSKAEFIMPNNTWARIDDSTQIQMIALTGDVTEMDIASGAARFYNRSSDGVIKATTPFGFVMAPAGAVFDLYVGDESVEVIAIKDSVDYVHNGDETKYEVKGGSTSIIADNRQVTSGEGNVDADWDNWNIDRDQFWNKRLQVKGDSVKYLPSQLQDDAATLEENGRWEKVQYEGETRQLWRPASISADWAPFTAGRWTEWNGDQTWVPAEPFGYVTHHYGNWVRVNNYWYWAPPAPRVRVRVGPAVGIGFAWYPGRVAWISSGVDVGWVPLAPTEVYYSHRRWGPRSVVINNVSVTNININVGRLTYIDRAIVVRQNNFYNVNNYRQVRITNINKTTIINNYRAAPVVNNTIINNYNSNRRRFQFTDVTVNNKPHQSVLTRIERNENVARQSMRVNARDIQQNVSRARQGQVVRADVVRPPKMTDKLVPAGDVNKPKSEVRFKQKDIKEAPRPPRAIAAPMGPGTGDRPGVRPQRPGQGQDLQPGEVGRPGRPGQPGGPDKPGRPGQQLQPGEPGRPSRPGQVDGPDKPGRPGQQPMEPGNGKDRVGPGRPGQQLQPGEPGRPSRPGLPAQPGEGDQKVKPPRPDDRLQPGGGARPGRPDDTMQRPGQPRPGDRVQPGAAGRPGQLDDDVQRPRQPRTGDRVRPGDSNGPARPGQMDRQPGVRPGERNQRDEPGGLRERQPEGSQRMRPRPDDRVQPGRNQGMQEQSGPPRTRPQRDQALSGEMGQPRQRQQEPGMRKAGEQQAPRREPGNQLTPEERRKLRQEGRL
jgi:hypothetical protein